MVLRGDGTQDARDRYGRLLAYVWLPGGRDLGYRLVAGSYARVDVYRTPASCHPSYTPCLPVLGDLDCADVRALGVAPVLVTGSDPYRLDGDGDGYGCE